jgi:penicillin-binding protein 1C
VGNFSGQGVQELTGAAVATPLLFRIFNVLEFRTENEWFGIPKEIDFRQVCEVSGKRPESFCKNTITDSFIPGVSSNEKCSHLKYVFVNPEEKESYCSACIPQYGFVKKLYDNLPPELIAFYRGAQIPFQETPPHNPACDKIYGEGAPVITNPTDQREYYSTDGQGVELMLTCQAASDAEKIHWYLDNVYLGSVLPAGRMFVAAGKGWHKISCSDDKGRNSNIRVRVR